MNKKIKKGSKRKKISKDNSNKNMRRIILLILILVVIGMFIGVILFINNYYLGWKIVNVDLSVSQSKIAFNLDTDSLHLGGSVPGGSSQRGFVISSGKDAFVVISFKGNLSEWLSVSENEFFISKGENKSIVVTANIPENASYGYYNAKMIINFYNSKYFKN